MKKIAIKLICVTATIIVILYAGWIFKNITQPVSLNKNNSQDSIANYNQSNILERTNSSINVNESPAVKYENVSSEVNVSDDNKPLDLINPVDIKQKSESNLQIQKENEIANEDKTHPVVFLGDSITEGLLIYGYFTDSVIMGINSLNTLSAKDYVNDIALLQPSKLFILLGINDIWEGGSVEDYISSYNELLIELKSKTPSTHIYVESLFPVSVAAIERNSLIDNVKIDNANTELKTVSENLNLDFIDVNTPLKDEDGNMKSEYSNDGVHLIDIYYPIWTSILENYCEG